MATASVAPRYAPEDLTLPKPWKGLLDGSNGYLYFWNTETNATQYERPTPLPNSTIRASSTLMSSSMQRSSDAPRHEFMSKKEGKRYECYDDGIRTRKNESDGRNITPVDLGFGCNTMKVQGPAAVADGTAADSFRSRHEISVSGSNVPHPYTSFESTDFPLEILRELKRAGFSSPTPIQAQSWPIALQGRDIVAVAKTGSGKTLGYLIPGFMHIKQCCKNSQMGPTVLVLSPTRELATQIQDEAAKFAKSSRISCTCLYGGAPKGPQLRDLDRGVDIVVATPGRLNDILEMRRISLSQVSYLVLDEADRMLDMGFEPQIRKIVKQIPARRQTLMFTATWPKEVRKIAADLLVNPVQVNIGNIDELVANKSITQYVEVVPSVEKQRRLEQILRSQEPGSKVIIFCSTKKMCDMLSRNISRQFGAAAIHGDKSQGERDYVLNQFRSGKCPILVATDVAGRGLDVKDIKVVINYDFPTGVEDYVHRIGRTGRAGATGIAHTFVGDQDAKHASDLIKVLEGANQRVPPEIRDLASRGGGMMGKRRWGSGSRDSGYGGNGGRGGSGYSGGNGGGRYGRSVNGGANWGYTRPVTNNVSVDRNYDGYDTVNYANKRSRSRSPNRFH